MKLHRNFEFALVLFALISIASTQRRMCASRDYGHGSTVCVCNATYCDDIPPLEKTAKGVIRLYETTKAGERFKETEIKFDSKDTTAAAHNFSLKIDRDTHYQKIVGFGGAFTDAAGINIAALPTALQNNTISDYFSKNGIEYTMGRIPIGGSDFSTRGYSYDDNPGDDELALFALAKEDFDYKIPYLKLATQLSPHEVRYFGSPWSPPAWFKNNSKLINGGFLIGKPGEKYYKLFAKYFVKFLDAYKQNGVTMWGLTIENEPGAGQDPNYKWNSLGLTSEQQRDFVKIDMGPTLEAAGYGIDKVKVMFHDDQRPNLLNVSKIVLADPETAKYLWGAAFHWYASNAGNLNQLDQTHTAYPNFGILSTEACEEWHGKAEHVSLGNWATFNRYANDIITDLNHWVNGWVDWNMALDLKGGPNWVGNYVDAPIIVNATAKEYYKQPFFYALGHFSKFLVPDSVRVGGTQSAQVNNFEITAFVRPDNATVVIALNMNDDSVSLTIDDPANGAVTHLVPPNSIQSYIWYS